MVRRIKRNKEFDISLQIKDNGFIRPPRDSQRNWLVTKALNEFASDLNQLHKVAKRFVPGAEQKPKMEKTQTVLDEQEIMEDWQIPVMQAMAKIVAETQGDILEVGYGRGVSANQIQQFAPKSHTIIECNDTIVDNFEAWRTTQFPNRDIRLIHNKWQDATGQLETYDGIFFHTYPLDESEWVDYVSQSVTFAQHFFSTAAAHLREGGIFTYLTNEIDSFSRAHQRLVFRYFRSFSLQIVPLTLPIDLKDSWWADSMVVIKAVK